MSILKDISDRYSIPREQLIQYLKSAPHRYKVYYIPKRNNRGVREIAQPARALKSLQKLVLDEYIAPYMPVHECATAYIKKRNIAHNAGMHAKNYFLLKMDFADFFPSITSTDFINHSSRHIASFSTENQFLVENLFFRKRKGESQYHLSAGAPSSPFISNTLMYDFDDEMQSYCHEKDVAYTRYADDIAFSSKDRVSLVGIESHVKGLLSSIQGPRLSLNESKTVLVSKRENRHLTGLVLTNDGNVSLGRERKRLIRSMIHRHSIGKLSGKDVEKLRGLLSFANSVEPTFYKSMHEKYGARVPPGLFF